MKLVFARKILINFIISGSWELITVLSFSIVAIPFLPATNILFYVGFVVAERVLYIPSMGYRLFAGFCFSKLLRAVRQKKSLSRLIVMGLVVTLSSFAVKTVLRNNDWQCEENLYRSGATINPPKGT